MTKTPEQLAREQAEAVLKIQQDAVETQMKMMEQLYGDNPEMLAQLKAQLQATMANQADLVAQAQAAAFAAGRGMRFRRSSVRVSSPKSSVISAEGLRVTRVSVSVMAKGVSRSLSRVSLRK